MRRWAGGQSKRATNDLECAVRLSSQAEPFPSVQETRWLLQRERGGESGEGSWNLVFLMRYRIEGKGVFNLWVTKAAVHRSVVEGGDDG